MNQPSLDGMPRDADRQSLGQFAGPVEAVTRGGLEQQVEQSLWLGIDHVPMSGGNFAMQLARCPAGNPQTGNHFLHLCRPSSQILEQFRGAGDRQEAEVPGRSPLPRGGHE